MKNLKIRIKIVILSSLTGLMLSACGSGGGSAPSSGSESPTEPPVSEAVQASLISGRDFSCLAFNLSEGGQIWCRTEGSPDSALAIPSAQFSKYVEVTGRDIDRAETWDDTICFTLSVTDRPYSSTAGIATYCMGEANLGPAYSGYNIIYSPPFQASNLSAEVWTSSLPFAGADHGMEYFTNEGSVYGIMQDSRTEVSESLVDCTLEGTELTCQGFVQALEVL